MSTLTPTIASNPLPPRHPSALGPFRELHSVAPKASAQEAPERSLKALVLEKLAKLPLWKLPVLSQQEFDDLFRYKYHQEATNEVPSDSRSLTSKLPKIPKHLSSADSLVNPFEGNEPSAYQTSESFN